MRFRTLFFDLDDTLYPSSTGLWDAIRVRMEVYMRERLSIPAEKIPSLREQYSSEFGTTLRGLQTDYTVDADDFLAFVHHLPLDEYLAPNPRLRALLESLPQTLWVFTNADAGHAGRVLKILTVEDCFSGIIDVRAINFYTKPSLDAYRTALSIAGESDARKCVIFDDSARNLESAKKIGFFTIRIGDQDTFPFIDLAINDLLDLPDQFPDLWS